MIRVSIMIKSNRFITSIGNGYAISPNKWDSTKQCVKKGAFNSRGLSYAEINNRINSIASEFQIFESGVIEKKSIDPDSLKLLWESKFGKEHKKKTALQSIAKSEDLSLFSDFDRFIAEERITQNWHPKTVNKFTVIRGQLSAFNAQLKYEDITKESLSEYCRFLEKKYNLVNSTIKKHIAHLRQFFRWAMQHQFITNSAIFLWKPKLDTAKKPVIYLEWEELMTLLNFEFPESLKHLERIRDCFVFQCFTGLRYSDLYNLRKADIRGNSIHLTTIKTSDTLEIQLNKYSNQILEKYRKTKFPEDKALPVISNQKMNDALKIICKQSEISTPIRQTIYKGQERIELTVPKYELIGTHCGRRTFVCNALMLGIAPDIVMKWTGHCDYRSMKPYIDISNKAKAEAMELFNK